jgi:hypothetical protein
MQDELTNVGRQKKCILMLGCCEQGFLVVPKEPPPQEFARLVRTHSDRLRALLDRPVTWLCTGMRATAMRSCRSCQRVSLVQIPILARHSKSSPWRFLPDVER